ncbi:uroporphyrinogen-III synthase [Niallia sp. XMNu-256]|uniref:uroporphyrinogen-III synthase n=1 Tax=Niallia sp. XMNu-256 TaxID=3082444 RepID=UPI0030CEE700
MSSSHPLENKSVLVPREKELAKSFSKFVKRLGGEPVEIPLLAFQPVKMTTEIENVIHNLQSYDWVIFTSNVTVETFLSYPGVSLSQFNRIAAIGEKTARALTEKRLQVDFVPTEYVAEAFVVEFDSMIQKGMKVLIPKGNLARTYIGNKLTEKGAIVDEIIVYGTYFPPESKALLAKTIQQHELDIVCFTSPSTVDHFMEVIQKNDLADELNRLLFACIGPIAKKRAESYALPVSIVPAVYTVEEMLKEVANYIQQTSPDL